MTTMTTMTTWHGKAARVSLLAVFGLSLVAGWRSLNPALAEDQPTEDFVSLQQFCVACSKGHATGRVLRMNQDKRLRTESIGFYKGQKWSCRKESKGWLFYRGKYYLSYRTSRPDNQAGDQQDPSLVTVSDNLGPDCYWTLVDDDLRKKTDMRFQATPTEGDFKGWFLSIGPRDTVTLSREKPYHPNVLWLEGP